MRPYQTLSLIGCIIGIFLMMGLYGLMGIGTVFNNVALNMTKTLGNSSQLTLQQQRHDATEASWLFLLILIDTYWQFMTVK